MEALDSLRFLENIIFDKGISVEAAKDIDDHIKFLVKYLEQVEDLKKENDKLKAKILGLKTQVENKNRTLQKHYDACVGNVKDMADPYKGRVR